jgi:UDP-glucuronate 4-epimerase
MQIVVTGCAGFIGSHVSEAALEAGHDVIGVDALTDNYERERKLRNLARAHDWDGFRFIAADLATADAGWLVYGCDAVIHLAGEPSVRASFGPRRREFARNNVVATGRLLEATARRPELRVVVASSSSVYGDAGNGPLREDARLAPQSHYAETKVAAEGLCARAASRGADVVVLRYFSVYGPRQRPDMAFHRFCAAALSGQPLTVAGDGRQTRDFTHVADVVAATLASARLPALRGAVLNVGGGHSIALMDVIERLEALAGRSLRRVHKPGHPAEARHTAADLTAVRRRLGWRPTVPLADGLAGQWAWAVGEQRRSAAAA